MVKGDMPGRIVSKRRSGLARGEASVRANKWKNDAHVDTLAAAYAETGDFENALKYQSQAIKLRGPSVDKEMEEHLRGYQERRPWRQEPVR